MMRKAFTLLEMMVSLGILAVILSFAGVIFRVSIDSQRMAMANAEVMQKLRIITEQLDADFKGAALFPPYVVDAYMSTTTETLSVGPNSSRTVNSDGVAFFTCGDFRSTEQYGTKTIAGNVACITYFQPDPNSYTRRLQPYENVLLRRQTIMAVSAPASSSNWRGEYYTKSPAEWVVDPPYKKNPDAWLARPVVEPNDVKASLPMYVAKGVDNFTIDFLDANRELQTETIPWTRYTDKSRAGYISARAFKFTFTLYDSKGILKKGRTFTHIVTWDNS